jgi:group I intron endonuclease
MLGYIYKITNPSGKVYIGQTTRLKSRITFYKNIKESSKQPKIYNSINKYGWNKHTFEIVGEYNKEELNYYEVYWIKEYDSYKKGLNCNEGGGNKPLSTETKQKISDSKKGIIHSGNCKGRKYSEETKEKMRASKLGIRRGPYKNKVLDL